MPYIPLLIDCTKIHSFSLSLSLSLNTISKISFKTPSLSLSLSEVLAHSFVHRTCKLEIPCSNPTHSIGGDCVDSYIVLVDLGCKERVRRVKKALSSFCGIDFINIDAKENKVHLKGNFDINRVVEAISQKSKRETHIIYPLQKTLKEKEVVEIIVVLRVPFDCQTCVKKVREAIMSIDGVSYIEIDEDNDKVIVKGRDINAHMICYKLCSDLGIYSEILSLDKLKPKPPVTKPPIAKPPVAKPHPIIKDEKEDGDIYVHVVNNIYYPHTSPFSDEDTSSSCSIM